jgi:DNA (cytosine-5)-methyltransferase 1
MKFLSVFSGIEAASVAWEPLGWKAVGFSEIDPFPCSVLAHHFPQVPNFGDITRHESWNIVPGTVDLLVGGSPCQSFSISGKRAGLDDPRGRLMLTYLDIVAELRPRWIVWENVVGVLHSGRGRDFGSFLGGLVERGYQFAYRVLDARYTRVDGYPRGLPQKRRRVFVVGYSGRDNAAERVLLNNESMPTRGKKTNAISVLEEVARACKASNPIETVECFRTVNMSGDWNGTTFPTILKGGIQHAIIVNGEHIRYPSLVELERAQGFPDNWTNVMHNGKPPTKSMRVGAIGNSMAVNCMRWIGRRIEAVEAEMHPLTNPKT